MKAQHRLLPDWLAAHAAVVRANEHGLLTELADAIDTAVALETSIAHWAKLAESPSEDARIGARTCALCFKFLEHNCEGCPVRVTTGRAGCRDTPYERVVGARNYRFGTKSTMGARFRSAALDEVRFLQSLRGLKP